MLAGDEFTFSTKIDKEIVATKNEIRKLAESLEVLNQTKVECDTIDYALAASSGVLCGLLDIFFVGKPEDSVLGKVTDQWAESMVKKFAKIWGWRGDNESASSAIRYLENQFKVPYDQRGAGDSGKEVFGLNPSNHHFKSLAHNPSLLGLFFSILNQFTNTSHFVSDGQLIALSKASDTFELQGSNFISQCYSGFINWIGHLISDISGSSGSSGRGMGIPSPLWTWTNDIIAIKRKFRIPISEWNKTINELALEIFNRGYDIRFQGTQIIPVLINELIIRFFYAQRRFFAYKIENQNEKYKFSYVWKKCEPFSNPSVKRMLTVGHGAFCLLDIGEATVKGALFGGGSFNLLEFTMRINIIGIGRLTLSLGGEMKRIISPKVNPKDVSNLSQEKIILSYYLDGLKQLAKIYSDDERIKMIADLISSDCYLRAFETSVEVAYQRKVIPSEIIKTKKEGDNYFRRGKR